MEIYQLKTFVVVAREGSITRASEQLHLSQPAVSAHVKSIEDELGLTLFDRTPRGMVLTRDGERMFAKAEQMLASHHDLIAEAQRLKGRLAGRLRLGASGVATTGDVGKLVAVLSERYPDLEVVLEHGTSTEIVAGLRNGSLDAGYYNEAGDPDADLTTREVSRFGIYLAAAPGLVADPADWRSLGELAWIYPTTSTCCGKTAETVFRTRQIRPKRIISIDREQVTHTLVTSGVGVGLLHAETALAAADRGELTLLHEVEPNVRVLFAHLASRGQDPLVTAVRSALP